MEKSVLKLCVDNVSWVPKEFAGTEEQYRKAKEDNELDFNSMWYLHGELESLVGYDKAWAINCKSAGYSLESINYSCISGGNVRELADDNKLTRWEMHVNDIIPVKVKGVDEPCLGYFWTIEYSPVYYEGKAYPHWQQRGLVCLKSDMEGRVYAMKCYEKRNDIL